MDNDIPLNERVCLYCGDPIVGRSDKKFCDDQCRNTYNNKVNRIHELTIIETNKILRKNRSILSRLSPAGKTTIPRTYLELGGFDFDHFTKLFRSKNGNTYYIVYDHGYMPISVDKILIVSNEEDMQ